MSLDTDSTIQLGHDIISTKYYALATCAILFYDYFLTLADEIKYIWIGKQSWIFWLFFFNRYFPMTWQLWRLGVEYSPQSQLDTEICHKTAWYSLIVFVLCTLVAQVVLTIRIYAVTMKNGFIVMAFAVITTSQFVLGMCAIILAAGKEGQPLPQIPLDAYHVCIFVRHQHIEVAYTSISLVYDFLAFFLFVFLAKRSKAERLEVPMILDIIAEDAAWYFLVIFPAHLILVFTLSLARPSIQLLPASGTIVFLSVMVSRIILSLKKSAASSRSFRSLGKQPARGMRAQTFHHPRDMDMTCVEDGISLDAVHES